MLLRLCAVLSLALPVSLASVACVDETSADTQASSNAAATPQGRGGPPPQEAFDACANLAAADACAFDIDGHHVIGTCKNGPDGDGPLACAPEHPPLPQEAIDACVNLAAADACAFDIDGHHITGTCKNGPDDDGPLACAPDQPPPTH